MLINHLHIVLNLQKLRISCVLLSYFYHLRRYPEYLVMPEQQTVIQPLLAQQKLLHLKHNFPNNVHHPPIEPRKDSLVRILTAQYLF